MKKVWLWWSGGKDSAWALYLLQRNAEFVVERLLTTVTPTFGRVAIHGTRIEVLEAQASALGVAVQLIPLPYPCSNAEYLKAVQPVITEAEQAGIEFMAFGDIFLRDVREYREQLLSDSQIEALFPLWGIDTVELSESILASGLESILVCLDPEKLSKKFAGAKYDRGFLDQLSPSVDPCGENGEFHTLVTSGPMFERGFSVRIGETVQREGIIYTDVSLVS